MKKCRPGSRGFSAVEMLAVLFLATVLVLATGPPLVETLRNSRLRAATRHIATDVRNARSEAVGTGWQQRIAGVSAGSDSTLRNHYRIMSRSSPGVAWPAVSAGPTEQPDLIVGEWVDVGSLYPGVEVNPADAGTFAVAFGPRGTPIEMSLNFSPLQVAGDSGRSASVRVSTAGNVQMD